MAARELRIFQVRRALFENAELRQYAIALGRDPRARDEVGRLIAGASGDRGPRGVSE